ncbi:MAG: GNAT family N-acetyltransferase, partial [Clostridia bacterium]|nr:GNAT family N-acetyltransferase [Clostridia bacterium]
DQVYSIMEKSFPKAEYRPYEKQYALLDDPNYNVTVLKDKGKINAFIAVWKLCGFDFVEHLAVDPDLRGQMIGSHFMKKYLASSTNKIVLEVEDNQDEIAIRRIGFYERLGFVLTNAKYIQPTLSGVTDIIPLRLMCYPNEFDTEYAVKEIFNKIYKKNFPTGEKV